MHNATTEQLMSKELNEVYPDTSIDIETDCGSDDWDSIPETNTRFFPSPVYPDQDGLL